jgi:hypothetical protein
MFTSAANKPAPTLPPDSPGAVGSRESRTSTHTHTHQKLMSNTPTIAEILAAKAEAGPDAYLWLQAGAGDCILWASEEDAENDDGSKALQRWQITAEEADNAELLAEVDDLN